MSSEDNKTKIKDIQWDFVFTKSFNLVNGYKVADKKWGMTKIFLPDLYDSAPIELRREFIHEFCQQFEEYLMLQVNDLQ